MQLSPVHGDVRCLIAVSSQVETQHGGSNWPIREDVINCHITRLFFTDINSHKLFSLHFSTKMSSWLSSNLTGSLSSISNLTGQISSFTREILTEGAEEVSGKIYP